MCWAKIGIMWIACMRDLHHISKQRDFWGANSAWKAQDVGARQFTLCRHQHHKCVNTFVHVNQYPWKSNLPEISRPDGAAGFSQPDGATDTLQVTIALGRLPGAGKNSQINFPLFQVGLLHCIVSRHFLSDRVQIHD